MSYFQSPLHPHILSRRNLSQHFQTYHRERRSSENFSFQCNFCQGYIDGRTSMCCCEKCGFHIHTSCATPPRQIEHPRHEHPLDLQVPDELSKRFYYRCVKFDRGCNFELDTGTVMKTLWVDKYYCSRLQEARDGESRPRLAHQHPLTSFPVRRTIFCGGCKMQISEEAHGCRECDFFLHEACAKAPLEIQSHPFHLQHPLYLFYDSSVGGRCPLCDCCYKGVGYRCEECHLTLDLSCVFSTMPCEDDDDDDEKEDIERRPSVMDPSLHPHQLSSYHSKTQTNIQCRICYKLIASGDFFCCSDCIFFLHRSCAQPPMEIKHYLHPEHTLTFAQCPDEEEHECPICESQVRSDSYCYACQTCDLFIHQDCASSETLSDTEKGVDMPVQCSFHEHVELKLYYPNNCYADCAVCKESIYKTPAYKCFSRGCNFKLHKSCAQLPSNLVHPSHPPHPLTLCFRPPCEENVCRRCSRGIGDASAFSCGECDYSLHVDCAQMPTLKHPLHEHSLFYFCNTEGKDSECSACCKSCNWDLFPCGECDFHLHYECSQFPSIVKSERHWAPLVLHKSFKEDDSGEYYCDICERRRDPNKWIYYCQTNNCQCRLIAHVNCALSPAKLEMIEEDDFVTRQEDIQRREEEIKLVQEQVDAEEVILGPLMAKLYAMTAKLESQRTELEELKTEHAKWIDMEMVEEDKSVGGEEGVDTTDGEPEKLRANLEELET